MRNQHRRRGTLAVAMVMVLIVVDLMVIHMVINGGRDHVLSVRRLETIQSFYAAEAGMNMSMREMIEEIDEDVDGVMGSISNNTDDDDDPAFGAAKVVVTAVTADGQTTLTSTGRSGGSKREMEAVLE